MIVPPKRSVTRFFIPLIDVLTLLFCIFLLMPYVKPEEGGAAETPVASDAEALAREVEQLRRDRDRLARQKDEALRQLAIRVLEIDSGTGKLHYYDPGRVEVASQADAVGLIARERRAAAGREVYFLILYPRDVTGYPQQRQVATYERWFAGVPQGFDNPRARR